jgi:putative membrane protein
MTESEKLSSNELAQMRTDLATSRNLMAADRTLMAWVRTSLSLNSFGFTIYKVLKAFQQGGGQLRQEQTPRNIGLFLTGLGTFAMLMGTVEYWQTLKELRETKDFSLTRPSLLMAVIMSVMGAFLFVSIITKIF